MSLRDRLETLHIQSPPAGWAAGTVPLVPAPIAPLRNRVAVYSALLSSATAGTVTFANSDGTPISGVINLGVDAPLVLEQPTNADPWFITNSTLGLSLIITAGPIFGDIYYLIVPGDWPPGP